MIQSKMITQVTKTDFTLEDGAVIEHPVELEDVPSVEEFQATYDYWHRVITDLYEGRSDGQTSSNR